MLAGGWGMRFYMKPIFFGATPSGRLFFLRNNHSGNRVLLVLLALFGLTGAICLSQSITVSNADGSIAAVVTATGGNLTYSVTYRNVPVIEPSPLGVTIDGTNLGVGVTLGTSSGYFTNISFSSRQGVHAVAAEQINGQRITVNHAGSGISYLLDVGVASNGVAFRYEFDDGAAHSITAESSSFVIPTNSTVWFQTDLDEYQGLYSCTNINAIVTNTAMGPPVTIQLAGTNGFLALTESTLGAFPNPYLLKVADNTGRMLKVAYPTNQDGTTGGIIGLTSPNTPWNVIMIGADLNMLANNDLVESLAPAPDPALFPLGALTSWATNGLSVWDYLDPWPGGITYTNAMTNSYWAAQLGFQYNTIDAGWSNWNNGNPWPLMQQVVNYSHSLGVKVIVWINSQYLQTTDQQLSWINLLKSNGVDGFKADFWDYNGVSPSAKEREQIQISILQEAASNQIVVTYHGRAKPTGQFRTYPNLLQVEGVYGQEQFPSSFGGLIPPLTRFLAGPADFTPFGLPWGPQTAPYRIAQIILMPGPIITIADRPDLIAKSAFAPLIKSIPSLWDETIVLSQSKIDQTTAFARRKGSNWYLALMNSGSVSAWNIPLTFLSPNVVYHANVIRDTSTGLEPMTLSNTNSLGVLAQTGGGEVVWFSPIATNPPSLTLQPGPGANIQLTWNAGMLLEATNILGPWTTITSATSPFTVMPIQPQSFYRAGM